MLAGPSQKMMQRASTRCGLFSAHCGSQHAAFLFPRNRAFVQKERSHAIVQARNGLPKDGRTGWPEPFQGLGGRGSYHDEDLEDWNAGKPLGSGPSLPGPRCSQGCSCCPCWNTREVFLVIAGLELEQELPA